MTINLTKGDSINLTKAAPASPVFYVGMAWNKNQKNPLDLDVSAFLLTADKATNKGDFVFFNELKSGCGGVVHSGDNRTGDGDGDDETLTIDTTKIRPGADQISIIATIYDAKSRGQSFNDARGSTLNIYDSSRKVIASFKLDESFGSAISAQIGSLQKGADGWTFVAVGQGYDRDLGAYMAAYGLS